MFQSKNSLEQQENLRNATIGSFDRRPNIGERDLLGLNWIWNFGWLRAQELGRLLWPGETHSTKSMERLGREWKKLDWVLARKLPRHNGTAWVLTRKGAAVLKREWSINAYPGTDWGKSVNGAWTPPKSWKHDLLAAGYLSLLFENGFTILPERQIRRENPYISKIPDGLFYEHQPDSNASWLEVEAAEKDGLPLKDLANAIIKVAIGDAPVISGIKANTAVVACSENRMDSRGNKISDHDLLVKTIMKLSEHDVTVSFVKLKMSAHGVVGADQINPTITADSISRIVEKMDTLVKWAPQEDGSQTSGLHGHHASIQKLPSGQYFWTVQFEDDDQPSTGISRTIAEAKRCIAAHIDIDRD